MTNVTNPKITPKPGRRGKTAAILVAVLAVGAGAGGTAVHLAADRHGAAADDFRGRVPQMLAQAGLEFEEIAVYRSVVVSYLARPSRSGAPPAP